MVSIVRHSRARRLLAWRGEELARAVFMTGSEVVFISRSLSSLGQGLNGVESFFGLWFERPTGLQAKDEPGKGERADSEDGVTDDAQPAQFVHERGLEEFGGAGVPHAVFNAGPGLQQADGQQADEDHEREADVHGPEAESQRF